MLELALRLLSKISLFEIKNLCDYQTTLSTEVSSYKQRMATFETELEFLRQQDVENREQLQKTSLQLQRHKTELSTTKEALLGSWHVTCINADGAFFLLSNNLFFL